VSDATKDRINPIFCEVSDATVASDIRLCKQTIYFEKGFSKSYLIQIHAIKSEASYKELHRPIHGRDSNPRSTEKSLLGAVWFNREDDSHVSLQVDGGIVLSRFLPVQGQSLGANVKTFFRRV
jgi:hypothetical protein